MKKLFLAVALVMGLGTSVAFANNMVSDVEIVTMINEFKPIDVKELRRQFRMPSRKTTRKQPSKRQPLKLLKMELRLTR